MKQVENKIQKNVPDINLGIINAEDVHAASSLWLRHIQCIFHSKKYDALKKNLNVFIDEHGLFRCRGRFANSSLPYERSTRYYYQRILIWLFWWFEMLIKVYYIIVCVRQLMKLDVNMD